MIINFSQLVNFYSYTRRSNFSFSSLTTSTTLSSLTTRLIPILTTLSSTALQSINYINSIPFTNTPLENLFYTYTLHTQDLPPNHSAHIIPHSPTDTTITTHLLNTELSITKMTKHIIDKLYMINYSGNEHTHN